MDCLGAGGFPILVGASRKRFLNGVTGPRQGRPPAGPTARDGATAAVTTASALMGAWCVRVHAVPANAAAVRVAAAIRGAARHFGPATGWSMGPNTSITGACQGMIG
ncbi:MAG: dihydropteroate synthase [Bifidobacteriaceae bacterium]|nr:dihydropteroate synthase [Bifidobacteriaceae bacterium]